MYLTHVDIDGNLLFVMVLPFELKHLAKQSGFIWNNVLPGAWATDNQSTALAAVKTNRETVVVAQPTLDSWLAQGKILADTHAAFSARLELFEPDRKMKAAIEAATMSDDMITAIHTGLRNIAEACDGTLTEDFAGFNRNDVEYGHTLAAKSQLTRSDAGYGKLLLFKYRRQLGEDLYSLIFPEVFAREVQAAEDKANKKLAKAAEKFHKKGKACDWSGCQQCTQPAGTVQPTYEVSSETAASAVMSLPEMNEVLASEGLPTIRINEVVPAGKVLPVSKVQQPCTAETMASGYCVTCGEYHPQGLAAIGSYDPVQNITQVTAPASVVAVKLSDDQQAANPEIIRLATSLIDCFAGDFDTVVDALRDLRGIDAPKDAKSESVKEFWQAAGHATK